MANLIITIDGPAGSGKSTIARLLAAKIDGKFLDTGAMYRAVTLAAMWAGVDMADEEKLLGVLRGTEFDFDLKSDGTAVRVDGVDVSEQIRDESVTSNVHYVASLAALRCELVNMQRRIASKGSKIVTEGRDQGTVAFPDADFKFYLTASLDERARRRQEQLNESGSSESVERIRESIQTRDMSDETRDVGPLKAAAGAVIVDTTGMDIEQVVGRLSEYIEKNG